LIQSSLLFSFWFQDAEDVKQSWYWTGVAISIAQTIGIHRNPDGNGKKKNKAISERQRRNWRNLWWACFYRDTWLAFGMGRPLRINIDDCDCPMPTLEDSEANFQDVVLNGKRLYAVDSTDFANLWLELLGVSEGLHQVLSVRYRGHASSSQIYSLKTELAPRFEVSSTEPKTAKNIPLTVATKHLNLHRLPAQIALFRPDTDISAIEKVREAANSVNAILEKSITDGTAPFSAPTIVPLIAPALYTHLMAANGKRGDEETVGKTQIGFWPDVSEDFRGQLSCCCDCEQAF
jgi:hypothetical protein